MSNEDLRARAVKEYEKVRDERWAKEADAFSRALKNILGVDVELDPPEYAVEIDRIEFHWEPEAEVPLMVLCRNGAYKPVPSLAVLGDLIDGFSVELQPDADAEAMVAALKEVGAR